VALIRYKDESESVHVVNETGFMNTFMRRENDAFWKQIYCIQTNIKSKTGCGKPYIIAFYAPVDAEDPEAEIVYDYKGVGEDEGLVKHDMRLYCLKQCFKIAYYMQKVHKVELLRMRAEFLQDDNGTVTPS